jgi:hypothetical protein
MAFITMGADVDPGTHRTSRDFVSLNVRLKTAKPRLDGFFSYRLQTILVIAGDM